MKILFVACTDSPFDHNAGSGKDYEIYHGLAKRGAEMALVGPFAPSQTFSERVFRKAHRMLLKRRPAKYPDSFLKKAAAEVQRAIAEHKPDVIFTKYLSIISRVHSDVPLVVLSDTTLTGSQREWPIFTHAAYLKMNRAEKKGYDMARGILVHSRRSVDDLLKNYHQPAEKIHMHPCPASIPAHIIPKEIPVRDLSPLKILIVAREYERKGVDIAIDVVHLLNQQGVPAQLKIVGLVGKGDAQVKFLGLYNKTRPDELRAYADNYLWANFLIHPARFEAAGIAPAEAAAFGVPTITNDVGGLATTVADGVSGVVLPRLSPAESYVQVFRRYVNDPAACQRLCQTTRQRYETELNWDVLSEKLFRLCQQAAASQ
jgi:glycosyltransferase involved in cell wall biosynthesis